MSDWRDKLAGLNQNLQAKEQAVEQQKLQVLNGFRKLLTEHERIMKGAAEFGDAFGVDCAYTISRFDQRYPSLSFRILKPVLEYVVECRDGVLEERLKEGEGRPKLSTTTLEHLAPKLFEQKVNKWVQAAAAANRKVPGRRA